MGLHIDTSGFAEAVNGETAVVNGKEYKRLVPPGHPLHPNSHISDDTGQISTPTLAELQAARLDRLIDQDRAARERRREAQLAVSLPDLSQDEQLHYLHADYWNDM